MAIVLRLTMGTLEFPEISLREEVLNKRQCENLLSNIQKGVGILQTIPNVPAQVCDEAHKNLFRIVYKGRVLIEECCNENWVGAIVMQLNNKEWFRELLSDFESCFHTLCEISCHYNPHEKERILAIKDDATFYPASINEVEQDRSSICRRLSKHLDSCNIENCKDCGLGLYLEEYLRSLQRIEGGELDNIIFSYNYPRPKYGAPPKILGECNGGGVYLTNWLGVRSATKVIDIRDHEHANQFWKEASILGGLNHPNIIKFFCCGFHEANNQFELVMELGERTLSQHLSAQGPLKEMDAVDIMLQIAKGMCYLHDMKVAHRDLKPANVVVAPSNDSTMANLECIDVKLLDFGISKVEVKHSPQMPKYMAPEAMAKEMSEFDDLKADVFSFGMMCSDILSGEKPHFGMLRYYSEYIHESNRPNLPPTYSMQLRSLVNECWSLDPSRRPTFLDIYKRLARLKDKMLKGSLEIPRGTNDTSMGIWESFLSYFLPSFWQLFLKCMQWLWFVAQLHHFDNSTSISSIQEHCNDSSSYLLFMEVNDNNLKETSKLIGVEEKMSKLEKQLQRVGSLGIVGMGGIGKSTLAKALSNHISHHFDAVCFVIDIKNEKCTFALKHKSKDMQDATPQETTLSKTRDILECVRKTKKILLVVDNVSKQIQLCQLLDDNMFKDVDGMRLIASSRDWNSLKQHVPTAGKVNMQTLKGDQPMRLFSRHAFGTNQSCLPYLTHVVENIVSACCGLPLSLEVMGTHMQGETRLRVWERTLHRLLRARHDGSPNEKLWNTLRISYDELSIEEKNMFLDIACFFYKDVFTTKETFLKIFDGNAREILESLHNKSLVKVDEWDRLDMHDQLRDMGRMITEKEFAGTRLLDFSYPTFANHCKRKGTELIQGLSFTKLQRKSGYEEDVDFKPMGKLHILNVQHCNNIDLLSSIVKESPNLKYLRMHFSTSNVPSSIEKNDSIESFWNHSQSNFQNLRVLEIFDCDFSGSLSCAYLRVMPLKAITFSACQNIEGFLNEIVKFSTLESLTISRCTNLETIPEGLSNLYALEELTFSKCGSLRKIPEGLGGLTSLKKLDMSECEALEEIPFRLTNLCALEELNLSQCFSLRKIPEGFGGLASLKKLYMWECSDACAKFALGLSNLCALEELVFSKCQSLRKIPQGFGGLTTLK